MDFKLKKIDHHCGDLIDLIVKGTDFFFEKDEWMQPLANLKMASGIESINYNASRFDKSFGWCSSADTFVGHQEILEEKLVLELCRFHFIWSALEASVDIAIPPKQKGSPRGKINNACFYIKEKMNFGCKFPAYSEELLKLEALIELEFYYSDIYEEINFGDHINHFGKGVFLAYKLRNKLAHGALELPQTLQDEERHINSKIVHCLSRLTLYTIQIITMLDLSDEFPYVPWYGMHVPIETACTHIQYDVHPEDLFLFNDEDELIGAIPDKELSTYIENPNKQKFKF